MKQWSFGKRKILAVLRLSGGFCLLRLEGLKRLIRVNCAELKLQVSENAFELEIDAEGCEGNNPPTLVKPAITGHEKIVQQFLRSAGFTNLGSK